MSEAKSRLTRKLREVSEVLQGMHLLRGFLFSVAVFGGVVTAAVLLDNILHLPWWLRAAGFFGLAGLGCYLLVWRILRPLLRRVDEEKAALAAEKRYPEAENLLINAVQLSRREHKGLAALMVERVVEDAAQFAGRVEAKEVAPRRSLRKLAFAATLVAACLLAYLVVAPTYFKNGIIRYIRFRSNIAPITATQISVEPGDASVLWGEALTVAATVKAPTPQQAFIRIGNGEAVAMRFDGRRFVHTIPSVRENLSYSIAAGDAVAGPFHIRVVYRPTIQRADITFNFPAYSHLPPQTIRNAALNIQIVSGTTLQMVVSSMQELDEASIKLNGREFSAAVSGKTAVWTLTPRKSATYHIRLSDKNGNVCRYTYTLQVKKDAPPVVQLLTPRRDITLVSETASDVHLLAEAEDDLAVVAVGFEIEGPDGRKLVRNDLTKGRIPPRKSHITYTLPLSDAKPGQTWRVRAFASDGHPSRKVVATPWVHIRVISAAEQMRLVRKRLGDLRSKIERILRQQIRIREATARGRGFERLAAAQDFLRRQTLQVADFSALSPWEERVKVVLTAVGEGAMLRAFKALVAAKKDPRAAKTAVTAQDEAIAALKKLLADIKNMLAQLSKAKGQLKALKQKSETIKFWEQVKKGLETFVKEQKEVVNASEQLRKKGVENWTEGDEQVWDKQTKTEAKWEKFFEDKKADLSRLPEQDFSDSTQRKELIEMFEEVKLAKDAFTRREVEVAVPTAKGAMEKAEELVENLERWLSDVRDNIKWVMQEPPQQEEIPLAELPDELEDIIGDLIDREDELGDEVEDVSSAWAGSFDKGAGWTAMDGPISSMSAKGITGNLMPNRNEVGGRSGEGRMGRSSGQFVEQEATGKGGRQTPTRLTPDPYEAGSVKDRSPQTPGGATGGGKLSGGGEEGLRGPVPPDVAQQLKRLAGKQALLAERAERLARTLKKHGMDADAALAAAQAMSAAADALKNTPTAPAKNLYRFLRQKNRAVAALMEQARQISQLRAKAEALQRLPKELREEILSAQKEPQPERFRQILRAYYQNLAKTK